MEVSSQLHTLAALPVGKNPGTHWVGGWVCPGAGLDILEKSKISFPANILTTDRPACKLVTMSTVLSQNPQYVCMYIYIF
jgi:hypothetical protein